MRETQEKKTGGIPHKGIGLSLQGGGNRLFPRGQRFLACLLNYVFVVVSFQSISAGSISWQAAKKAHQYSSSHGGISLLIKQGDSVLLEKYDNGGTATRRSPAFSMTKSFCGLMAMAADAERIFSLEERVSDTISEWRCDPVKSRITVQQLLDQTSGLTTGYNALYASRVRDKGRIALQVPGISQPGSTFLYGPSHWEVFEEFLRRKLRVRGAQPLAYLRRKVLAVCGADIAGWRRDNVGNPYFSTGAMLSAPQLTKIGDFILNSGRRNCFQLIPKKEFEVLNYGSPANPMYRMGFWLNRASQIPGAEEVAIEQRIGGGYSASSWRDACISKHAPPDLIAMVGSRGQRLYVVPSRRLIVARQGKSNNFRDSEFLRILLN